MSSALPLTVIPEDDGQSKILAEGAVFFRKRVPWGTLEQDVLLGRR